MLMRMFQKCEKVSIGGIELKAKKIHEENDVVAYLINVKSIIAAYRITFDTYKAWLVEADIINSATIHEDLFIKFSLWLSHDNTIARNVLRELEILAPSSDIKVDSQWVHPLSSYKVLEFQTASCKDCEYNVYGNNYAVAQQMLLNAVFESNQDTFSLICMLLLMQNSNTNLTLMKSELESLSDDLWMYWSEKIVNAMEKFYEDTDEVD